MEIQPSRHVRALSDFRRAAAEVLRELRAEGKPILLTQRGRPAAVLMDVALFERMEYATFVRGAYREGLRSMGRARGTPHEEVIRQARSRLRQ